MSRISSARACHESMLGDNTGGWHDHYSRHNVQNDDRHGGADEFCVWLVRITIEGRYYLTAAAVVLFLDILLTLDVEIERVWRGKFTRASLLFFINRYLPPVMYAIVLFSLNYRNLSNEYCTNFFRVIPPVIIVFSEAVIGALLILRTCALYKETKSQLSHLVVAILVLIYFVQLALSVFAARDLKAIGPLRKPFNEGCILFFTQLNTMRLLVLWFTNMIFNVVVFMCTFKKTAKLHWLDQKTFTAMHSLILLDATMYFLAVMAAKTVNLVMLVFYPEWNSINWAANHVIDVILTSHFFLNLREEGDRTMRKPCTYPERRTPSLLVIRVDARFMDAEYQSDLRSRRDGGSDPFSIPTSLYPWRPNNSGDRERSVRVARSPSSQTSGCLRQTMKRVIEDVLETKGYMNIVLCDVEEVSGIGTHATRGVSTCYASSRFHGSHPGRRHSVS